MKKIYMFLVFVCCVSNTWAQRYYSVYRESDYKSDTIVNSNYTYVCDTLMGYQINIYNINNHPGRGDITYTNGDVMDDENIELIDLSYSQNLQLESFVDEAFSKEQVETLDGAPLIIALDISSTDGKITDVYYSFFKDTGYTKLPIDVFYDLEMRFKDEMQFELTEEGRKMNYCYLAWSQCPRGREESEVVLPEDGGEQLEMPSGGLNNPTSGNLGTPAGNSLGTPAGLP